MNRHAAAELMKIAMAGYRKKHGVLIDKDIPVLSSIPKEKDKAIAALYKSIGKVKGSTWSHAQVAVPVKKMGDLRRMGFSTDPGFAIPLPGEGWFSKTWRHGKLHAHQRGPLYVFHADRNPGFPKTLADLKHLIEDVPPALLARLKGASKVPVILKNSRKS